MRELIYRLKRLYHFFKTGLAQGLVAQIRTGFPNRKLKIIAITGTDGKTTTSTLIYHLLKSAGHKVGLISTVAAYIGDEEIPTGLHVTAPTPNQLYPWLKKMVERQSEYLVLELTSHGIYQYRSWGIKPLIAGVTNITHEHLDYHLNYQLYLAAKALLLQQSRTVFLNEDDHSFLKLRAKLNRRRQQVKTYSSQEPLGLKLKQAIKARFPETYNQLNARLAIKIVTQLGLTADQICRALPTFPGVPGRMEVITTDQPFKVVIDFAHTPNALENSLTALRPQVAKNGRLIAVFGCAGLRDQTKRPLMGQVAAKLADLVILTAEDPRTENVWSIIRQIKEQLTTGHQKFISIADRGDAIEFALTKIVRPNDLMVILGKGPEASQCIGKTEYPWSDKETALKILAQQHQLAAA